MFRASVILAAVFAVSARTRIPFPADASLDPFPRPKPNEWQWIPMNGSRCIDGSQTGVYIKGANNLSSRNVAIYLEGGGACFNAFTCDTCRKEPHPSAPNVAGQFDNDDTRNPYATYTWIWVPYCTGDVHLGQYEEYFERSTRHFAGRINMQLIMARVKATWPTLDRIVLTGESAGGFGAGASFDFVRSYYPSNDTVGALVDDSGPVLDDEAISVCLQQEWRTNWDVNASLPAGCPCVGSGGNMVAAWDYISKRWPRDAYGLISSVDDAVISTFFSFGNADCASPFPTYYGKLSAGLDRLSSKHKVPVYMIPGHVHTHTGSKSSFYTTTVNGVLMYEWITDILNGKQPSTVRP
eukprot:TRINITY_DN69211_c0_g1_i1.p2 TRINITY_DN69211_c0_g1~~TRINITY_DN69211_c0_g1_i1.p2  ORF type:complete len:353 (+),score=54.38 TRINITY_DN69211_c0_g1_i1:41-1099(+)